MLKINPLKKKIDRRQVVWGVWNNVPSPALAEILASGGLDFIIIDMEHGPLSFETALLSVPLCESRGVSPLVRVPGVYEQDILRALDIGAHGLHVPNVRSVADVEKVVEYSKYPPLGNRGFSPFTRAGDYTHKNSAALTGKANDNTLLVMHVEGLQALNNIDELLTLKALDVLFIGLYDLSKCLGCAGDVENPKVKKVMRTLVDKINKSGKCPATIATDPAQCKRYIDMGIRYITYSVDCEIIRRSIEDIGRQIDKIR